jgi:hypothetical protein
MIRDREQFWSVVDEALDERREPREDALVQEWIADHADDRDELVRLMRGLGVLASSRPRGRRTFAPLIAAAAVVVLGFHLWTRTEGRTRPPLRPRSRVLSFSIEVTRESDGECTSVLTDPDHTERSQISRLGSTVIVSRLESRLP